VSIVAASTHVSLLELDGPRFRAAFSDAGMEGVLEHVARSMEGFVEPWERRPGRDDDGAGAPVALRASSAASQSAEIELRQLGSGASDEAAGPITVVVV
jgi:hypothetical protein